MEEVSRLAAGAKVTFGHAESVLVPLSKNLFPILASTAVAMLDITKLEIIRDFNQFIALFIAGLAGKLPNSFRSFWASVTGPFAFCFSCWFYAYADVIARVIFLAEAIVGIVVIVWFYSVYQRVQPADTEAGLETVTWTMASAQDLRKIKIMSFILTTLFLPLARDSLQIALCDHRFVVNSGVCYRGWHAAYLVLAAIATAVYLIPTPFLFLRIIKRNMPRASLYDTDGTPRSDGYNDDAYRSDLSVSTSPFKSLFDSYERRWAFHKVLIMVMKFLLVLPATIFVESNQYGHSVGQSGYSHLLLVQSLLTIIILGVYIVFSAMARPFLDSKDDVLDTISRVSIFGIAAIGLASSQMPSSSLTTLFSVLLHLLTSVSTIVGALMILSVMPSFAAKWKDFRQRMDFTMSSQGDKDILILSNRYSPYKERKRRIWNEFWDILFAQDPDYRLPNNPNVKKDKKTGEVAYVPIKLDYQHGDGPPFLTPFLGTVAERHHENKKIASSESVESFRAGLAWPIAMRTPPNDRMHRDVAIMTRLLNGLDVYYSGDIESADNTNGGNVAERMQVLRQQSSQRHFGKAYVLPFPFCVVWIDDECDEKAIFSVAPILGGVKRDPVRSMQSLANLIDQNTTNPDILLRRRMRQMLRAMSGNSCYFLYRCEKTKTKSRQVTNSKGETHTETYTVTVLFTFQNGTFAVNQKSMVKWRDSATGIELNMARGFAITLSYADGVGVDREGKHWTNEHETIGAKELGIPIDYHPDASPNFQRFLYHNWALKRPELEAKMMQNEAHFQMYRDSWQTQFDRKEMTMSYAFWFFVYNNDRIERNALWNSMSHHERNPLLNNLMAKHEAGISMLYQKLLYFDSHPVVALWFCFWHDLWIWNFSMAEVQAHKELLDPFSSSAVLYSPLTRSQLVERFKGTGTALLGHRNLAGLRTGFINDQILDRLYAKIDQLANQVVVTVQPPQVNLLISPPNGMPPPLSPSSQAPMPDALLDPRNIIESYRLAQYCTGGDYDLSAIAEKIKGPILTNFPHQPDP